MKTFTVITSINKPTEAVIKFANFKDIQLIVVGDKKTPTDYNLDSCIYLSVDFQDNATYKLSKSLPYNHYCRKMIGYLEAIKLGADEIIDTDDDNIPYDDWSFPEFKGSFDKINSDLGFINIYQLFTGDKIWPRGLPLHLINKKFDFTNSIFSNDCNIGIWQGLADEDPDVDAIYRLTNDAACYFNKREPIVCSKGTISPFNTQNTIIRKELFPLLYLPTFVTFRYTDILRGLVAQPIMWLYGYELGFTQATVIQKRNPHDYFKDFISEIPMFETTEKVVEIVTKSISINASIEDNLLTAYSSLHKAGIVTKEELLTLNDWLVDLSNLTNRSLKNP